MTMELKNSMQAFRQRMDNVCTNYDIEMGEQAGPAESAPATTMIFENDTVGMI